MPKKMERDMLAGDEKSSSIAAEDWRSYPKALMLPCPRWIVGLAVG